MLTVQVTISDCFLCTDVDLSQLNQTNMERLLRKIFAYMECEKARINPPPWAYPDWVTANDVRGYEKTREYEASQKNPN